MRNTALIALNVIKDAARKKLFLVVILFALALIAVSPLIPTFEIGVQSQFLRDMSLSLTLLFSAVIVVVLSVGQVPGEIEKRTIFNVLSKPVSRLQYLVGKYLGILATLAMILIVIGLEILLMIYFKLHIFSPGIFQGVFTIFLEGAVIAAFCLCLSTFVSVPVNVFATILFYLLCHVKTGFLYEKLVESTHGVVKVISWPLYYLIPNLENFNISLQVGYKGGVSATYILRVSGYAILFSGLFVLIGFSVLRKKDL